MLSQQLQPPRPQQIHDTRSQTPHQGPDRSLNFQWTLLRAHMMADQEGLNPRSAEAALVRLCGLSPVMAVALVHGRARDAEGEEVEVQWGEEIKVHNLSAAGAGLGQACGKSVASPASIAPTPVALR